MPDMRDFERDDLDHRRKLSTDEKVDLMLDRLLGNRLRGTIGLVEVMERIANEQVEIRQQVEKLNKNVDHVMDEQQVAAEIRLELEKRISRLVWQVNGTTAFSLLEGVAIIYLLLRVLSEV